MAGKNKHRGVFFPASTKKTALILDVEFNGVKPCFEMGRQPFHRSGS